jgi:phenylpropionate dioxygenase-like ring-hydroxylating dioxygenase large terminal subunit
MLEQQETIREREDRWKPRPTLSGSDYTSPEVWEEERERIWFGDWVCIGRAE